MVSGPAEVAAALLRAHVEAAGCELYDVVWAPGLLRVLLDREGGIDLDTLTTVSPVLSAVLDAAEPDPLPGRYTLEVSSPGLERQLKTPAHYRRFVGTPINVKLTAGAAADGDRRFRATLDDADEQGFTAGGRRLSYDDVELAMTVFEWGPAPKPGGRPPKTQRKAKVQP
ncbi:MAG: Bacterial ribosome SSU maturation protein RimP [uncultured Acidimicrobiales bacterium]|uniref:Ribosome maturation factor RimP n=1 Tax=uncultured Acidimicrobiales bacterium TaxID=310071 RepID=A0A6J4H0Q4_9ACTN|nr:MAG: Bacterial ribosome SSU maturation protein RimP [uncultured Acidimicrobiales bacterium]